MLTWDNIGKSYGRRLLFAGLSGSLAPGSGIVVTGPNGSGKSTFLKILAGLVRPDFGQVVRPIDTGSIGYASPSVSVYAELSGVENVQFALSVRGMDAAADRALPLLSRLGLGRAAHRLSSTYSTGMIQRLKLACAMAHDPALLILDEPTIGLDEDGVALVEQVVAEHIARGGGGAAVIATNERGHFAGFDPGRWAGCAMGA